MRDPVRGPHLWTAGAISGLSRIHEPQRRGRQKTMCLLAAAAAVRPPRGPAHLRGGGGQDAPAAFRYGGRTHARPPEPAVSWVIQVTQVTADRGRRRPLRVDAAWAEIIRPRVMLSRTWWATRLRDYHSAEGMVASRPAR